MKKLLFGTILLVGLIVVPIMSMAQVDVPVPPSPQDGNYTINPFGTDSPAMLRETEPNNTFLQANAFQLNGEEFAGQLYSTSDVDVFKFNVDTQGVISLSMKPENSFYDGGVLRVLLKDSNSNVLAGRNLRSDSTIVNLSANIATLGNVYLVIDQKPGYQIFDKDYQITPSILTDPYSISHREIEPIANDLNKWT